jgi:peroxiredoxin
MIELGELEKQYPELQKRDVHLVAISQDDLTTSKETQAQFPHLFIAADPAGNMAKALDVVDPGHGHEGEDTNFPTTILVDGSGTVRWVFRPDRFLTRLSPQELLVAIDENLPRKGS